MLTSEKLKEWYGMPQYQPSTVDEEILVIIDEVAQLETENIKVRELLLAAVHKYQQMNDWCAEAIDMLDFKNAVIEGADAS